jgi:glycosyltransferase involved in cell wall biosynthesis
VGAVHDEASPNADSLQWFLESVWPLVRAKLDVTFTIAGLNRSEKIRKLAADGVILAGRCEELRGLYDHARVFVAPTRFGAGIPIKVQEATGHGLPVVTTSLIAGQLGWQPGIDLLAADSPKDFAERCIEIHAQRELWETIRRNALARVERECSPTLFTEAVRRILAAPDARSRLATAGSPTEQRRSCPEPRGA